jgi:hypothetical protein
LCVAAPSDQARADTPALILACEHEHENADLIGALITADGGRLDYRRAHNDDLFRLCDASGNVIDPSEILETGELTTDWFAGPVTRPRRRSGAERSQVVVADALDRSSVARAVVSAAPDAVVHLLTTIPARQFRVRPCRAVGPGGFRSRRWLPQRERA